MPIEKLIAGFSAFHKSYIENNPEFEKLITEGQMPDTLVIACSDSRNDPALLMQSAPGDIFVVRNVAALVPPYQPDEKFHGTSAAIEFAVKALKVQNIIVLGHALCGGVQALSEQVKNKEVAPNSEFIHHWISIGEEACQHVHENMPDASQAEILKTLERKIILTSLDNLMSFPFIAKRVDAGDIKLHGWYFDMVEGCLQSYNPEKDMFENL